MEDVLIDCKWKMFAVWNPKNGGCPITNSKKTVNKGQLLEKKK